MSRYFVRRIEENPAIILRTHSEIEGLDGNGHPRTGPLARQPS
ncbi:MAG TPA: hypothetical protein VFO14_24280 [Vicinamibacterales bacterium]|nr:hypothetical protein [Vicinamibacterales bacterium]